MTTATATRSPSKPSSNHFVGLYDHFARFANKWQSPLLLFIRLYIGYQCIISGWNHLHNFDQMVKNFQGWRIPLPHVSVAVSASTELIGGALLLIGLASRFASLVLTGNFFVAMLSVELANYAFSYKQLWAKILEDQSPILGDTAFPFFVAAVLILVFGPGFLSVDGIIKFVRRKK